MGFTPVARWRNFKLETIKEVLNCYSNLPKQLTREAGEEILEKYGYPYKQTAYQLFCQLGLQNRGSKWFKVQEYVLSFSDAQLKYYMKFWLKTYYAPNPYIKSSNKPILIYKKAAEEILNDKSHKIDFKKFFEQNNMNGSNYDILKKIFGLYGDPIKVKHDELYIDNKDVEKLQNEVNVISQYPPIVDKDKKQNQNRFFNRYTQEKFEEFYNKLNIQIPEYNPKYLNFKKNQSNEEEIIRESIEQKDVQKANSKDDSQIKASNTRLPQIKQTSTNSYVTDLDLKKTVIENSGFECEYGNLINEIHITFEDAKGKQYMEGHHIIPMSAQHKMLPKNLDRTENIISLCPNCHKAVHYGSKETKQELVKKMFEYRKIKLKNAGINIKIDDLLKCYL